MALAKNDSVLMSHMRQFDKSGKSGTGKVLFADDFEGGFDGWRDHFHGGGPAPILSRTDLAAKTGTRSLMIPVRGYPTGMDSSTYMGANNPATFKNLSRYWGATGTFSLSAFIAVGGDTTDSLGGFTMMIDTQSWEMDPVHTPWRSFFKLRCTRNASSRTRQWKIGSSSYPPPSVYVDIPGANEEVTAGDNENKFNFNYVRLTIDLAANSGMGGYLEAQINHQVFDLSGLGGGHAVENPQKGTSISDFTGGFNCGVAAVSAGADTGNGYVLVDSIVGELNA